MEEAPSVGSQLKHILHLAVVQICKNFVLFHKTLALRGSIVLSADDQELCVVSFDEFIYSANDIIFFESVNGNSKRDVETTETMSDVQAKKNAISTISEHKHELSPFTGESHKFIKRSISNQSSQFKKENGEKDEQNLRLFCCQICRKEFTLYKTYIRHQRNFHSRSTSRRKKKFDCIDIVPEATRCGIAFEGDRGLDASSLLENGCNNSSKSYGCIDNRANTDVYNKMNLQYNTADCNMKSQDDFKKVQRIYLSIEDIMCSTGGQDNDSSFGIPKQNGVDSGVLTSDAFHDNVPSDKSAEISWSDDDVQGSLLNVEDLETMTSPGGMDKAPGLSSDGEIMAMPFCDNFELNNFMHRNPDNILDRSRRDSFLEHSRPDIILDQSRPNNNILEYENSFVNGGFQGTSLDQSKSDNEDGPICNSNRHLKQSASSENFPELIRDESPILASDQIKKFECSLCNASFSLSNNLRRHVKKAHGANECRKPAISPSVKKPEEKVLIVPSPPKTKPSSAEKHVVRNSRSSRSRYRHVCLVCGVAFTFRTNLTRHSKKIHGQMPADTEEKMSPS